MRVNGRAEVHTEGVYYIEWREKQQRRRRVFRAFVEGTSNPIKSLPDDVRNYPDGVAQALTQLRLVGVNGPYSVVLGTREYTELVETRDYGYPILEHVKRMIDGDVIWAPAIGGAFVLSTRGGDFELNIGTDVSIGYLSHTDKIVRLYLEETFTFRVLTSEALVALSASSKSVFQVKTNAKALPILSFNCADLTLLM